MTEETLHGRPVFICECGLGYDDILLAYACEQYFRQYDQRSTEIMAKATYNSRGGKVKRERAIVR